MEEEVDGLAVKNEKDEYPGLTIIEALIKRSMAVSKEFFHRSGQKVKMEKDF